MNPVLGLLWKSLFPMVGADVTLIAGTVLEDWSKDVSNNISTRNDFFKHYRERDKANPNGRKSYRVVEGGRQFIETLFTAVNLTFRGYADRATILTTEGNPIKEAQYDHKIIAGSINLSKLQEAQNMPAYQIHDLLEVKMEEAEYSMEEILGDSALSDGTTDTTLPGGLQQIIPTTAATTNNNLGTINSTTNSFWRPQIDTSGVTAWNTANEGMIALDALIQACKKNGEKIDLIVTTNAVASLINIMTITNGTINVNMGTGKGELGFDDVFYRKARVIADDNVPAQTLYAVNTRHVRFAVLRKGEFKTTKMKEPIDGLYMIMQMYVFCNFTCSDREVQGIMTVIAG